LLFKTEVDTAATAYARAVVAKKLIDLASENASPAEQFALLDAAESLAIKAGDANLSLAAVGKTTKLFAIKGAEAKSDTLAALSKTVSGESAGVVVDQLVAFATESLAADKLDEPKAAAQDAAAAARRSKDKKQSKAVTEVLDAIKARAKEIDTLRPWLERLASTKGDLKALEHVRKYHFFQADRWDLGRPLLAKVADKKLAATARVDMAATENPSGHLAAGDAWSAFANEVKQSAETRVALRRAKFHYQAALPELTGLNKAIVIQTLETIGKNRIQHSRLDRRIS